jgi:hypothetical protein
MKVYIITSGEYSDYHIERVFLNKEKAEQYVKLVNNDSSWNEVGIEELESSDDEIIAEIKYIHAKYIVTLKENKNINNEKIIKLQNMIKDKATTQGEKENASRLIQKIKDSNNIIEQFNYDFKIKTSNTLDDKEENLKYTSYSEFNYNKIEKRICIQRVVHGEVINKEKLKQKYLKVCQDLYIKIKSLINIEGWNENMIQEWLGKQEI